jgi:membrane protease subunit HflC
MKPRISLLLLGLLIAALFVFTQLLFTVRQGEVVVVTALGKPVRALDQAGLYHRWPWPVHAVHRFDNRIRLVEGPFEESLTRDGKNVLLQVYAGWNIADPIRFLERVGQTDRAGQNLDGLLRTHKNATLGRYRFAELINTDATQVRLAEFEERLVDAVRPDALDRYGITVTTVGIRRLGLPESITQSVFDRMRAERLERADRYRAEGEGESIRIRARADSERDQLLADAEAQARALLAEGDAAAAEFYRAFETDPDLALFLRKLEAMKTMLGTKSTLVLSSETEPFDLLKTGPVR